MHLPVGCMAVGCRGAGLWFCVQAIQAQRIDYSVNAILSSSNARSESPDHATNHNSNHDDNATTQHHRQRQNDNNHYNNFAVTKITAGSRRRQSPATVFICHRARDGGWFLQAGLLRRAPQGLASESRRHRLRSAQDP